ncbi:MAG: ABC transporter substrate-binding protein [Pontixanthobacter sp.]
MRLFSFLTAIVCMLSLSACGDGQDDDIARIAFIGSGADLNTRGVLLSPAEQHLRAATAEGLVALNAQGQVVPALAERWIVTDDGLSYIFRLRNSDWPDGTRLDGGNVKAALERNFAALDDTSLGLDLAIVDDVRAMTGRVIEIRLKSPMPQFLQLLAQPELGLLRGRVGTGPMRSEVTGNRAELVPMAPQDRGLAPDRDWNAATRRIAILALPARDAAEAFDRGDVDAVLNGHLLSLPLTDRGPLARGTVQLDIVFGLFGLQIANDTGLLADPLRREALAMAIERASLLEPFGIAGWAPSNRIVPDGLPSALTFADDGAAAPPASRWPDLTIEARRAQGRSRIAAWVGQGGARTLTLSLPDRVGAPLFFEALADDMAEIGVTLQQAAPGAPADLILVDRVARYGDPRWFLNQFSCGLRGPRRNALCAPEADALVARTLTLTDEREQALLLARAEEAMLAANIYIPIGAPVRWSLVRGGFEGFADNPWGLHPLFDMALRPI